MEAETAESDCAVVPGTMATRKGMVLDILAGSSVCVWV